MIRDPTLIVLGVTISLVALGGGVLVWAHRVGTLGPALFTLISRLAYGFFSLWTAGLGASDALQYNSQAVSLAENEITHDRLTIGKESFPLLLSWVYRVFGEAPEIGIVVNCAVAATIPTIVYLACRQLDWKDAATPAAWIVALWPVGIFWQGLLLRESLVIALLALALWGATLARSGMVVRGLAMLAVTGFLMMGFRGGLAFIPLLILPAALALLAVYSTGMRATAKIASFALIAVLVVISGPALNSLAKEAGYFDVSARSASIEANNSGSTSVSETGEDMGDGTAADGVVKLPVAAFGPYPWRWSNAGSAAAGLDGLLWFAGAALALIGLFSHRQRRSAVLCLLPLGVLLVYIGASSSNFGLIMRMRGVGLPFLAPLMALGVAVWLANVRDRRAELGVEEQRAVLARSQSGRS